MSNPLLESGSQGLTTMNLGLCWSRRIATTALSSKPYKSE
jgi:hypothetical protein